MPDDTTACAEQVHLLPLALIAPSPFNPRRAVNGATLAQLTDSVRTSGIHQPVVVRTVVRNDSQWELVFGHRRTAAARAAGLETIPAIVRELSDEQVLVAQAIENLQREDLTAFEEATGYQRLMEQGFTVPQICEQVGRKRTQVYQRLQLLKLDPAVKTELGDMGLGAEAMGLVARVPAALQMKACTVIRDAMRYGEISYRVLREELVDKFTLELKKSIFPPDDADLLPDAGACTTCPKRSGANPDLLGDLVSRADRKTANHAGEDICTDPTCFAAKKAAQIARQAAELQAKGRTVITGAAAKKALTVRRTWQGPQLEVKGEYVALADVKAEIKKAKDKGKAVAAVTLQDASTGKTVQAVKRADLEAAGVKLKKPEPKKAGYDYNAEQRRQAEERERKEAEAHRELKVRQAILERVRAAIAAAPRSAFDLAIVARAAVAGVPYEAHNPLAQLWGHTSIEKLQKSLGQMDAAKLTLLTMDCALAADMVVRVWRMEPAETLLAAARHYEVDAAFIRAEVLAQMRAADEDAAKKKAAADAAAKTTTRKGAKK